MTNSAEIVENETTLECAVKESALNKHLGL